jgi:hypothetical protein
MPRLSRLVVPGYPHHITQRGVRSIDIFADDRDRLRYLRKSGTFLIYTCVNSRLHVNCGF